MRAICTHLSCAVWSWIAPCHGFKFSAAGGAMWRSRPGPLVMIAVSARDGQVITC